MAQDVWARLSFELFEIKENQHFLRSFLFPVDEAWIVSLVLMLVRHLIRLRLIKVRNQIGIIPLLNSTFTHEILLMLRQVLAVLTILILHSTALTRILILPPLVSILIVVTHFCTSSCPPYCLLICSIVISLISSVLLSLVISTIRVSCIITVLLLIIEVLPSLFSIMLLRRTVALVKVRLRMGHATLIEWLPLSSLILIIHYIIISS